jgi:hypothetical protein
LRRHLKPHHSSESLNLLYAFYWSAVRPKTY